MNNQAIVGLIRGAVYVGLFAAAHATIAYILGGNTLSEILTPAFATLVTAILASIDHVIPTP